MVYTDCTITEKINFLNDPAEDARQARLSAERRHAQLELEREINSKVAGLDSILESLTTASYFVGEYATTFVDYYLATLLDNHAIFDPENTGDPFPSPSCMDLQALMQKMAKANAEFNDTLDFLDANERAIPAYIKSRYDQTMLLIELSTVLIELYRNAIAHRLNENNDPTIDREAVVNKVTADDFLEKTQEATIVIKAISNYHFYNRKTGEQLDPVYRRFENLNRVKEMLSELAETVGGSCEKFLEICRRIPGLEHAFDLEPGRQLLNNIVIAALIHKDFDEVLKQSHGTAANTPGLLRDIEINPSSPQARRLIEQFNAHLAAHNRVEAKNSAELYSRESLISVFLKYYEIATAPVRYIAPDQSFKQPAELPVASSAVPAVSFVTGTPQTLAM